jgi:inward rectifier potassium channel
VKQAVPLTKVRSPSGFDVWLVGATPEAFGDVYRAYLHLSWPKALGALGATYLAANVVFAVAYMMVGGVAHMRPGSFIDAYAFSIQTMGTIGYGAMVPESTGANLVVAAESLSGLVITAVATGLVFSRFSRIVSRVVFTSDAVVGPMDGVPTLSFRVGNEHRSTVLDAHLSLTMTRLEHTKEGVSFYRTYDLPLVRDHNPLLTRTWTVMHRIDPSSPLHGCDAASNERHEVEVGGFLRGVDDTTHTPIFSYHRFDASHIRYGYRHVDVLSIAPDGNLMLDQRNFDRIEPIPEA